MTAPTANNVQTGAFSGIWNGSPIVFFCFELTQYFSFGQTYTNVYTASNPSNTQFALLSELFTEAFAQALTSPENSAAFQLAVWEIRYDTSPTDLRSGIFHVTSTANSATVDLANYWLNHLPSTGLYTITWLSAPDNQDFVFGTLPLREAPEPSLPALVGIALAALAFVARRRRNGQRRA